MRNTLFSPWKEGRFLLLKEVELWDIVEKEVTVPDKTIDAIDYATYQKKNAKEKRVILDGIKDHLIPHVERKANYFDVRCTTLGGILHETCCVKSGTYVVLSSLTYCVKLKI